MGVYINGMEMPNSCGECRFFVDAWCYALEIDDWRNAYNKPQEGKRLDGCPLVLVPEHGRLIDADVILNEKAFGTQIAGFGKMFHESVIEYAPTVIPAEEGE